MGGFVEGRPPGVHRRGLSLAPALPLRPIAGGLADGVGEAAVLGLGVGLFLLGLGLETVADGHGLGGVGFGHDWLLQLQQCTLN